MNTTAINALKLYKKYKDKDMTILSLIRDNAIKYAIIFSVFIGGYILYLYIAPSMANFMLIGLLAILLRDFGYFRKSVFIWPTLNKVIDWEKLESTIEKSHN